MKLLDDFRAVFERDPASRGFWGVINVILTYPGFHAICLHRLAHLLRRLHIPVVPHLMMWFGRLLTGIEIHPAATIGGGFFIDHGFGVVIGETAEIGRNVTLYQGVTLGGTGKQTGKRHPTLGDNVVVGAGAKVLGGITIGNDVYIGANAVVLKSVADDCTVVGVPGRCVRQQGRRIPGVPGVAASLRHDLLPDPLLAKLESLEREIHTVEHDIRDWHEGSCPSPGKKKKHHTGESPNTLSDGSSPTPSSNE